MNDSDLKRLSRLTAILTQLQAKRLLQAKSLAEKFNVSIRTIYRDIRALEQAGVPIMTEEGKGYSLMEDYRLPPVMLTESEANALITAEQIVLKNNDTSFIAAYTEAISKIKSVLKYNTKDNINLLSSRIAISQNSKSETTSNHLSDLQLALTNFNLTTIAYQKPDTDELTNRTVEPFALLSTQGNWLLLAKCRLRRDFRLFRLDRMKLIQVQDEKFEPHTMTLDQYFARFEK